MRRVIVSFFVLLLLLTASGGLALAGWADHFPAPEAMGPGSVEAPGQVLNTLTPELKYMTVGSLSYVYIFATDHAPVTLAEQFSHQPTPVLMARINSSSLQIPAGILLPGKNYYWYVESIHAPGSKSEATKISPKLYFSCYAEEIKADFDGGTVKDSTKTTLFAPKDANDNKEMAQLY